MVRTLEEREKRALRRELGVQKPHSQAQGPADLTVKRERDFLAPKKEGYVVKKPRGHNVAWLNGSKRKAVEARTQARREFFAALRAG